MKHLLITTIAAVLLVGCEKSAFEQEFDRTLTKINKAEESLSEASRALMAAVKEGNIEAVKQHLDDGADVNAEGGLGTPLHFAADEGHKEIAELLIAKGADVNVKTEDGLTPLDRAIKYQRTETADLLRKHGGKTGEELKAKGN